MTVEPAERSEPRPSFHGYPDPFAAAERLLAPRHMRSAYPPEPPPRVRNGAKGYRKFLLEREINR
jgi:hypothetical protein